MKEFKDKFIDSKLQPQVFSLILVTIILIVLSIVIYRKVKKQKDDEAPGGLLLIAEMYVSSVDSLYKEVTNEKFHKPAPYIFTLITLLIFSNLFGLLGLEPPASSYSFTLTLALVSWIGIYVSGLTYQRFRFFKRFLNPLELITQFAPMISLSFRLFGNMIGGSTIMYLIYSFTGFIWEYIPVIGEINFFGAVFAPFFHLYFDIFDGLIQGFVFTLLTMVYWTIEASEEDVQVTEVEKIIAPKSSKIKKTNRKTKALKSV